MVSSPIFRCLDAWLTCAYRHALCRPYLEWEDSKLPESMHLSAFLCFFGELNPLDALVSTWTSFVSHIVSGWVTDTFLLGVPPLSRSSGPSYKFLFSDTLQSTANKSPSVPYHPSSIAPPSENRGIVIVYLVVARQWRPRPAPWCPGWHTPIKRVQESARFRCSCLLIFLFDFRCAQKRAFRCSPAVSHRIPKKLVHRPG